MTVSSFIPNPTLDILALLEDTWTSDSKLVLLEDTWTSDSKLVLLEDPWTSDSILVPGVVSELLTLVLKLCLPPTVSLSFSLSLLLSLSFFLSLSENGTA